MEVCTVGVSIFILPTYIKINRCTKRDKAATHKNILSFTVENLILDWGEIA